MKRLLCLVAAILSAMDAYSADFGARRDMVAAVLMAEARGDGVRGMEAVGQVIRNRGLDPIITILARRQFSCLNGTTITALIARMSRESGWEDAQRIAATLLNNPEQLGHSVRNANHFERVGRRPYWARGLKPVAVVGGQNYFYCR